MASVDSQWPGSHSTTTNQQANRLHKEGSEDAPQRGRTGQSQLEDPPPDESTAASLETLVTTLQESLTAWNSGNLSKTGVIRAYDQMSNELDTRIALFDEFDIDASAVESVSFSLRLALGDLFAEEEAPDRFDTHLTYIRASIVDLLAAHRSKHTEYIHKATSTSVILPPTGLDIDEPHSRYRAHKRGNADQHMTSQPSELVAPSHESPHPIGHPQQEALAQPTGSMRWDSASGQNQGNHVILPVPTVQTAVNQLRVSLKELLESLTKWSNREFFDSDVSDAYVRMGDEFHTTLATFQASGIDISDLGSVLEVLRIVLEQVLAVEATPENLEFYLPDVRQIIVNLLKELRFHQNAYTATKSDLSRIPSRKPGEYSTPSPRLLDDTNQLEQGNTMTTTSPHSSPVPIRGSTSLVDAAPALDSPSEGSLGTADKHAATRSQAEQELSPGSESAYKPGDAPGSGLLDKRSHTQSNEALPLAGPPSVVSNKPKITDPMVITRNMSTVEILEHLCRHGCSDVSSQLDTSKSSEYPISSGGYGEVYRGAFHDGSSVAIKCLRLPLDERAAQEIYVWSKCIHPNILGLTGVTQYRNQLAMVSPWMSYGSLRGLLSREPGIDRYNLCAQLVDGIAYLHEAGVVHGDIKGDNILFSEDLTPKLTDFGNATLKEYTLQFSRSTSRAGMSINWVAPEVLKDETGPTPEADIWSLGMTMLEVMTGEPPYAGILKFSVMRRIESRILPVRPEAHIPSEKTYAGLIWSLFIACWTYEPLQRPSAIEVQEKMKAVVAERDLERLDLHSQ